MGDQAVAKFSQLARNGKNEGILDCYKKLQNSVLLQFTSYSLMLRYFNFNPVLNCDAILLEIYLDHKFQ